MSKTERDKEIDDKTKAKARAEYQKLYQKQSEFMKQEMTGVRVGVPAEVTRPPRGGRRTRRARRPLPRTRSAFQLP